MLWVGSGGRCEFGLRRGWCAGRRRVRTVRTRSPGQSAATAASSGDRDAVPTLKPKAHGRTTILDSLPELPPIELSPPPPKTHGPHARRTARPERSRDPGRQSPLRPAQRSARRPARRAASRATDAPRPRRAASDTRPGGAPAPQRPSAPALQLRLALVAEGDRDPVGGIARRGTTLERHPEVGARGSEGSGRAVAETEAHHPGRGLQHAAVSLPGLTHVVETRLPIPTLKRAPREPVANARVQRPHPLPGMALDQPSVSGRPEEQEPRGQVVPVVQANLPCGAPEPQGVPREVGDTSDARAVSTCSGTVKLRSCPTVADYRAFNAKSNDWGYASPYLTLNEYATWSRTRRRGGLHPGPA